MASKTRRQQHQSTATSATNSVSELNNSQQVQKQQVANFQHINFMNPTQTYWKQLKGFGEVSRGTGWFEPGSQQGYRMNHSHPVRGKLVSEPNRVFPVQLKGSGTGVFLPTVNTISGVGKKNAVKKGESKKQAAEEYVGKQYKENTHHPPPELNLPPEWTY